MSSPLFDLHGRVALVTGAARGMGRAMAIALAEHGADLLLADRNADGLAATTDQIASLGRRALPVVGDVADLTHLDHLIAIVDREFGQLDILGNVAGEAIRGRPESIALADVQRTLHNLVISRFYLTQLAGQRMLSAGRGSIISIGSLASTTALGRGHISYSMSMGAVIQMTRELSTEWSGRGVRVNAILPAQVLNPGLAERIQADPGLEDTFLRGIPRGRLGVPEDIKGLAVFLASDAAAWITGALIPMDGGNLALNAGGSHTW